MAQTSTSSLPRYKILLDSISRKKDNANAPGHYDIVATINKGKLNHDDTAKIEVYITGYGQIKQPKIIFSSSNSSIFDNSYIIYNLGSMDDSTLSNVYWGASRYDFDRLPTTMTLSGGLSIEYTDGHTRSLDQFLDFDRDRKSTSIITETVMTNAPITIYLKIKDNARPDDYKFNLNFTYFNGNEWTGSSASVDLRVNNWIQKNEVPFGIIAVIAAIVAILPGFEIVALFFKSLFTKKQSKVVKKR